jgi:hypothetical protein
MINIAERIDVEPEGFVPVSANREHAAFLLSGESIVEGSIQARHFFYGFTFIFAEVDDHEAFFDDACDRGSIGRTHS